MVFSGNAVRSRATRSERLPEAFSCGTFSFQQVRVSHNEFSELHRRGNANGFFPSTKPKLFLAHNNRAAGFREEGIHFGVAGADGLGRGELEVRREVTEPG